MSIFSLKSEISDLKRLRFIVGVLFEAGGRAWIKKIRADKLVPLRCRIRCFLNLKSSHGKIKVADRENFQVFAPKTLKTTLIKLGPAFIKFGQALSLRSDIIGEEMASELSELQNHLPIFSYEQVRSVIKKDLGDVPESLFRTFDPKPVGSASLAQVHKAVTMDGKMLAVKVQRPEIRNILERDIHILFYLAHLAKKHVQTLKIYRPVQVVKEFADWTERELDFRMEGHNADRFHAMYENNPHINIPKIHWGYTSRRVLAMEYVDGVKADDLKGMAKRGIDSRNVAMYGIEALLKQFFIEGFFHADPHPGNFFCLKGDILCLHDFGIVGTLTKQQRQELLSCFIAFANKDIDGFHKHFLHLAEVDEGSDISAFRKDVANVLSGLLYSSHSGSVARAFFSLVNSGLSRSIRFPTDLVLFAKALITTESMGLSLYPEFDLNTQLGPFAKKALKEYLNPKKMIKEVESEMFDYAEIIRELPSGLMKAVDRVGKGELGVKLDTRDLEDMKKEFDRQNDVRILGATLAFLFGVTALVFYSEGRTQLFGIRLSTLGTLATIIVFIWFIVNLVRGPRK